MARLAGFVTSIVVLVALAFVMALTFVTFGEPKPPAKQIIYFIILVVAVTAGWAAKSFVQRTPQRAARRNHRKQVSPVSRCLGVAVKQHASARAEGLLAGDIAPPCPREARVYDFTINHKYGFEAFFDDEATVRFKLRTYDWVVIDPSFNHCRSRTLRDHRPSAARSDHFTTNGLNGYGNPARRAARPCVRAGRPFPGALRVEAAPAACASATQAGKVSPAGLKPLTASRARSFDSPRSSRPRFSAPARNLCALHRLSPLVPASGKMITICNRLT
jgi:hypothetical protein